MNSRPDELVNQLLLDILNDHALSAELDGLGLDGVKVLLLAAIGEEAHDLVALEDQPSKNCTRIETYDFHEHTMASFLCAMSNLPPE